MNDADREEWVNNDEGLYLWWKGSGKSKRAFIRENREELTRVIKAALGTAPGNSYVNEMANESDRYRSVVTPIYKGFREQKA